MNAARPSPSRSPKATTTGVRRNWPARLGNDADCQFFLKRAGNYKNVFRQDKGHVWPKDADGNWIEPFDPGFSGGQGGRDYTTENNGYTYDWDVQHDLPGLFELMGGRDKAEAKLDQLFRQPLGMSKYEFWAKFPDASGLVGQFSMGNEPSLHIPYLYNYLGAPWKTQKRVRMLISTWFTDTTLGMPGDEDGGGMSAFVVFSMMGFYPVTPGVPIYNLASPVFDRVTIRLHNGKTLRIVSRDNSEDNKYIQSLRLNGRPLDRVLDSPRRDRSRRHARNANVQHAQHKTWFGGVRPAPIRPQFRSRENGDSNGQIRRV